MRETWQSLGDHERFAPSEIPPGSPVQYPATYDRWVSKRRPSIHMPRWASRITLKITNVRVERLQDISAADAKAEGLDATDDGMWLPGLCDYPEWAFRELWEGINGPESWTTNPWVWVVEFHMASMRMESAK